MEEDTRVVSDPGVETEVRPGVGFAVESSGRLADSTAPTVHGAGRATQSATPASWNLWSSGDDTPFVRAQSKKR
jgi:hypothetical protein